MTDAAIASRLGHEHVADIVEFLNGKTAEEATDVVSHMPLKWAVEGNTLRCAGEVSLP